MSEKEFVVRYEIDDGYAGGSRPQSVRISADYFADCTEDEAEAIIEEIVNDDFLSKASPVIRNFSDALKWAVEQRRPEDDE